MKLKVMQVCVSFLLLLEILSAREEKAQVAPKVLTAEERLTALSKDPANTHLTWEEIVEHDKKDDLWVVIYGKVYDLTTFWKKHPGGDIIVDGAGGDCTPTWESYHPLKMAKRGPHQKYWIGMVRDYEDFYNWDGEFYDECKKRVETIVPHETRRYDTRMYYKTAVILVLFFATLYWNITWYTWYTAVAFALVAAQVGVNIMHDGCHFAFSKHKWLNRASGLCLELVGTSAIIWKRSHNFGHHGCVNHLELDRAFDTTYPILRLHPGLPWMPYHKWQWLYGPIAFAFVNFGDMFGQFDELYWLSNFPVRRGHISNKVIINRWLVILCWLTYAMFLPWYLHGYTTMYEIWWIYIIILGIGYVWFFAVNHWTTEANMTDFMNISKNNWGKLQVTNSNNFALDSVVWNTLSGGLNHQIEHHLFPGYIHTRLFDIKKTVKECCEEFGIRYYTFPTFWGAIKSNIGLLYELGKTPRCYGGTEDPKIRME